MIAVDLDRIEAAVRRYLDDAQLVDGLSVVHRRGGGRGAILRAPLGEGRTVIVKIWKLNRGRDSLKRLMWMSNTRREWRVHCRLYAAGVRVPQPLAYRAGRRPQGPYELIVVEDLGRITNGLSYLKDCLRRDDQSAIADLEREVIANTVRMVRSGVLDIDNKLNNFGITAAGELYRFDLECARRWRFGRLPDEDFGAMMGHLVCSHAFACQPNLARTEDFARRLVEALQPQPAVLAAGRSSVERILRRQKERSGLDSRLMLPW